MAEYNAKTLLVNFGNDTYKLDTKNLWEMIYPVGSIYMSVSSTSPSILFGGTWEQIQDRFLISSGSTYAGGSTGGSASVNYTPSGTVGNHTLTTSEMPSHAHGLNSHKHSVGAHSHGLNSHKHSVGAHAHGLNSHTHGVGTLATNSTGSHHHEVAIDSGSDVGFPAAALQIKSGCWTNSASAVKRNSGSTNDAGSHSHTITGATAAASGNTANSTAFDTGAASGSTANSTAFDTGAASGDTGATGGGGAHNHGFTGTQATINVLPPYLSVYMWKRTA